MFVLMDILTKNLYFKGFTLDKGYRSYSSNLKDALIFTDKIEAEKIAEQIKGKVVVVNESDCLGLNFANNSIDESI